MITNIIKLIRRYLVCFGIKVCRDKSRDWQQYLYPKSNHTIHPLYVNIGAGGFYHPMWTNVDMPNEFYQKLQKGNVHVVYDLCSLQPLPFESGSVAIFYTSHTIEHLPNDKVRHLFAEIHRCLKVGGIFRVTCPDMEIQYRAYQNRDEHFWSQPSPWLTNLSALENRFIEHFATALTAHHCVKIKGTPFAPISPQELEALFSTHSMEDFFDTIISRIPPDSNSWFPEGHCNWFTPSKVLMMLKKSGFAAVYQSGYGQSADPRLRNTDLFDSTCPELSLYAEAVK